MEAPPYFNTPLPWAFQWNHHFRQALCLRPVSSALPNSCVSLNKPPKSLSFFFLAHVLGVYEVGLDKQVSLSKVLLPLGPRGLKRGRSQHQANIRDWQPAGSRAPFAAPAPSRGY